MDVPLVAFCDAGPLARPLWNRSSALFEGLDREAVPLSAELPEETRYEFPEVSSISSVSGSSSARKFAALPANWRMSSKIQSGRLRRN